MVCKLPESQYFISSIETHNGFSIFKYHASLFLLQLTLTSTINSVTTWNCFQGFLKVHSSLTALITHHSIMPELLPVTLNIHRHNPSFSDMDHDYASLQDFTQFMRDMKISGSAADPKYDQLEEEDAYQWNFTSLKIALILWNLIKTFVKKFYLEYTEFSWMKPFSLNRYFLSFYWWI